jgi:hypothetical protein
MSAPRQAEPTKLPKTLHLVRCPAMRQSIMLTQ